MARRLAIAFGLQFDPHQVLGVRPGASPAGIREAYHRVAKKYHHDRGGDEWAFRVVLRAYEILTEQRDSYPEISSKEDPSASPLNPIVLAQLRRNPSIKPHSTGMHSIDGMAKGRPAHAGCDFAFAVLRGWRP
jgi:hypothetical protein